VRASFLLAIFKNIRKEVAPKENNGISGSHYNDHPVGCLTHRPISFHFSSFVKGRVLIPGSAFSFSIQYRWFLVYEWKAPDKIPKRNLKIIRFSADMIFKGARYLDSVHYLFSFHSPYPRQSPLSRALSFPFLKPSSDC